VEDAAAIGAPLWLSYLFLLFYIAIAAGGVTHADLLLENPVELPFLNIKLPLIAFFVIAPFLFVISHAYTLAHFALLADKAKRFHVQLRKQIDGAREDTAKIRTGLRQQLPINVFVQFLAGPEDIREGPFSVLLWVIVWTTLVAFPMLVLLLLQLQFLPFHDTRVSWWHRTLLICDLALIWALWLKILSGRSEEDDKEKQAIQAVSATPPQSSPTGTDQWTRFKNWFLWVSRYVLAWPLTAVIVLFCCWIATFPGEWGEWPYRLASSLEPKAVTNFVFGEVDALNDRITGVWPTNTLRLQGFNIYESLKVEGPKKLEWKEHTFDLQHRHLEHADFRFAKFDNVDLRGASLEGAWLSNVQLQSASLEEAHLRDASLEEAHLEGARLDKAKLQSANLKLSHLEGAQLEEAELEDANLDQAFLGKALLKKAHLRGASLFTAQLQEARLIITDLNGASLIGARLQGASLEEAELYGAFLSVANLEGATLTRAHLQGAWLDKASLQGASLWGANLIGASLVETNLEGASFESGQLQGALFDEAKLAATDFMASLLWRTSWRGVEKQDNLSVRLNGLLGRPSWEPIQYATLSEFHWKSRDYSDLRRLMEGLPEGANRDQALTLIERLDCCNSDTTLASCEPNAAPPPEAATMRTTLEKANIVVGAAYEKALKEVLWSLVCSPDVDAIHILRGVTQNGRLIATRREAPALVDAIMSPRCPVSAALTEDDRAATPSPKK
jgi:uncharacterized protein YjbI with pentapeptide repeats